jgi:hypothetical protein
MTMAALVTTPAVVVMPRSTALFGRQPAIMRLDHGRAECDQQQPEREGQDEGEDDRRLALQQ